MVYFFYMHSVRRSLASALFALAVSACAFAAPALASPTDNVFGWAWTSPFGWISLNNCVSNTTCPYGGPGSVNYGTSLGTVSNGVAPFSGWGWSDYAGWVCFGTTCSGTAPDGRAPWAEYRQKSGAAVNQVWGWAQVIRDGSNGWISLNCGNLSSCATSNFFVTYDPSTGNFFTGNIGNPTTDWGWCANPTNTGVGWTQFYATSNLRSCGCTYGGTGFSDSDCHFCHGSTSIGCTQDSDCSALGVSCDTSTGAGTCQGDPTVSCRLDSDCTSHVPSVMGPCNGANSCTDYVAPWLQTQYGNVFTKKQISADIAPPSGRYSASFCITAGQSVSSQFTSQLCSTPYVGYNQIDTGAASRFTVPSKSKSYITTLGRLDIDGLLAGRYGRVVHTTPGNFASLFNANPLGNTVYVVDGNPASGTACDLSINSPITINNASGNQKGNGTVVVNGGNLCIMQNITYQNAPVTKLNQVGSIGWIALENGVQGKGSIFIDNSVTDIVGAYLADADGVGGGPYGISSTLLPGQTSGTRPLTVQGLLIARKFTFGRTFHSIAQGSERIIYDGRAAANPPPGFADLSASLPTFVSAFGP